MPIVNGSIHYEMPDNIKSMITIEFCTQFLKELHQIFGASVEDSDMDYYVYQGSTAGWGAAFANTCRKLNMIELYKYYLNLEWFDSDIFDGELEDLLVEYKLIIGGFLSEEVARQNNLQPDDVICCEHCGKYILTKDSVEHKVELENDPDPYTEEICKTCDNGENVTELSWDINRSVTEVLGKTVDDIFVCEKCGKTHWKNHKGDKYCLHCETEQIHTNCNVYYRESLDLNKEYKNKIKNV